MVGGRRGLGRAGKSRFGCLLWLVIFGAVIYYGIDIGGVYLAYYQMVDAIHTQAHFANNLDDAAIRRRLVSTAKDLKLPDAAHQVTIRRSIPAKRIEISMQWTEQLELPFFRLPVTFHPVVREQY